MEWCTTENGKYRIESLSAATFPGALALGRARKYTFQHDHHISNNKEVENLKLVVILDAFCQDEAVSIGCEVNKNPVAAEELLELCADAALDGVSLVAIATATREVVAVAFNKIQVAVSDVSEKPFFEIFAEERCTQASSRSLIQFMADVDGRCNLFEKYGVDCSLEIMFLATLREHRCQTLGKILCKTSIDLAKKLKNGPVSKVTLQDLGPKYSSMKPRAVPTKIPKICQAIWTAEFSQKIGKALNFTVHLTVYMKEFVHDGKTYADRLEDQSAFIEVAAITLD